MKKTTKVFIVVFFGVTLFLVGSMVTAQAASTFVFDEYGVLYQYNPSYPNGLVVTGIYQDGDPWVGGYSLHWSLTPPAGVTLPLNSGYYFDVPVLQENGSGYSDVMRFYQPGGTGNVQFYYYSNPSEGSEVGNEADISPTAWTALMNSLYIPTDLGTLPQEINGQFSWLSPYTGGNYYGSSPVPEPATMILLALGLVGLAGVRKKS